MTVGAPKVSTSFISGKQSGHAQWAWPPRVSHVHECADGPATPTALAYAGNADPNASRNDSTATRVLKASAAVLDRGRGGVRRPA